MTLIEQLEELRRKHDTCEDCWYSCPKSGECCNPIYSENECLCGADSYNEKLDKIISELKAREGWISVVDRLPDIDKTVLWYCPDGHMEIWEMDKDMDWEWVKTRYNEVTPTHWMLLPNSL